MSVAPPPPRNEPVLEYRPGSPERAAVRQAIDDLTAAAPHRLPLHIGGARRRGHRHDPSPCTAPHRHQLVLGEGHTATEAEVRRGHRRRAARPPGLGGGVVRVARRRVPPRRRPARRAVAGARQRRDHARPEQDRVPGGDRRRLRAHRLLALQRALRRPPRRRPADLSAGRVEPHGAAPARGLRAGDHAVQLHLDRGQPAHRARADGQHGGVEAGDHAAAGRVRADAGARGGGPATRRHQHGHRPQRRGRRRPPSPTPTSPASTSPAPPPPSTPSGRRSATTSTATAPIRASSARPAARTSSSPTSRRRCDALLVGLLRGAFEYQGQKCSAASRAYVPRAHVGGAARPARGGNRVAPHGRPHRHAQLHGRGDRRARVPHPRAGASPPRATTTPSRSSPAASATTARAGSCGPPSSRPPTRTTT